MNLYLRLVEWLRSEKGQDLVEYALILGLVAIVAVVAITAAGSAVNGIWEAIQASLEGVL
jgi:pilus assembly protein Flp/PilA